MRITVVGTGYVGLVTGTCLADMGNGVCCQDVVKDKIISLQAGRIPIYEPGLSELVQRNVREKRLWFTTDLREALERAEICFIAVGTPAEEDGSADRRAILASAKAIAEVMNGELTVVVKSTVPVGTCDEVHRIIGDVLKERGVSFPYDVVSNPEFLKEGKAVDDFMRPDRIVVGANNVKSANLMRRLYSAFIRNGHEILVFSLRSAEMTKYAANAFLATRISLINEIAQICEHVGADVLEVRRGVGSDKRIGMGFLYPGVGYGGSCLPKDVQALARMAVEGNCQADIFDAVQRVNRHQKLTLANRIVAFFKNDLRERRIGIWGLAFKPMTDDVREAPALAIIKRLTEAGAITAIYDPEATANARRMLAGNDRVVYCEDPYAAATGADALALVTEWGVFRNLDFSRVRDVMKQPVMFDGRNLYAPEEMRELGFEYFCIGRPTA